MPSTPSGALAPVRRRQRPLKGGQWYAPDYNPIFPGGITVVLDYPMLASMPADQLGQVRD